MFVMLGNMIKHDHFSSSTELSVEATGVEFNSVKVVDNVEMTDAERVGVDHLMEADEELKPCWASPRPKDQLSNGFVTFSLTIGPEYHISQITDAVVIARYLGAALVLPEVRGLKLGNTRKFEDVYDVGKFMRSLNGVVKVIHELPDEVSARKPAVIRVPDQVTEDIISETIQPIFQKNNYLRLAVDFSSVSFQPKETNNKDLDSTACLAMFSSLQLKPEYSEVAKQMLARLKESSKESEGVVLAIDLQKDLLEKKSCRSNGSSRRKGCYYPHEVLGFLRKADIMPAENKGEFLKSSNMDLARALDLEICSQSDVFVPAITGLFYGHVTGKRIPSGWTQILVPAPGPGTSVQNFVSTYVLKKSHLAYKCYC
ncbi:hypothetical protein PR202_gb22180 [Eleusine coracana subsp. coracana]|uniref:O-fucosyltransferase family protein n=1 Tax=Eleusine coracana subsp. coracana TaxID=191504 RepID=A0AAV5FFW8_ELECO|nr:hypothetical protein PR202_gb22180 [Eleusine coracana subsp. coracana]